MLIDYKRNMKKIVRIILIIIFICGFLYSSYKIVSKIYSDYIDDQKYKEIQSQIPDRNPKSKFDEAKLFEVVDSSKNKDIEEEQIELLKKEAEGIEVPYSILFGNPEELNTYNILNDYVSLVEQNNDMVGWIYMPGFNKELNYPVMQAEDNEYYLYKDFYKNYSYAGSIFMDCRNNSIELNRHLILYGHNMGNNSMFGNLREYPNRPEDYLNHTKIYLDLLNTRLEYEIFSTYIVEASYDYRKIHFQDDDVYMNFLYRIKEKSVHNYDVQLSPLDKIITLSTCNGSINNGRSVTHARLVRQIKYESTKENVEFIETEIEPKEVISANVYLTDLALVYGTEPYTRVEVEPAVNTMRKDFTTYLSPEVEIVALHFETADPKATVKVTHNEEEVDPSEIQLHEGENTIKMTVYSCDWKFGRIYTINIFRIQS